MQDKKTRYPLPSSTITPIKIRHLHRCFPFKIQKQIGICLEISGIVICFGPKLPKFK